MVRSVDLSRIGRGGGRRRAEELERHDAAVYSLVWCVRGALWGAEMCAHPQWVQPSPSVGLGGALPDELLAVAQGSG